MIADPRMLESLGAFFPIVASIEAPTTTQNVEGEESTVWTAVPGLEQLQCAFGIVRGGLRDTEMRTIEMTRVQRQRLVMLKGLYPQITPDMHLLADGKTWNILGVVPHDQGVVTRLYVEEIEL